MKGPRDEFKAFVAALTGAGLLEGANASGASGSEIGFRS